MRRTSFTCLVAGWLLGLAVVPLGLAGCGEGFDPFNRLTGLRVLAIKADPPLPALGETATLSALIYTPSQMPAGAGPTPVSFQWSWCPFAGSASDGYPCAINEAELQAMAAQAGMTVPPFDLGQGETAMLPNRLNPLVLQQICAGVPGLPQSIDCEGGFPVQVKLTVKTAADQVVAVRTLRLRFDPTATANANPRIDGLSVRLPETEADLPIVEMPEVVLPRAKESLLKAVVPLELAETYTGRDENMKPAMLREQLTLTWFVESGDTDEERTRWVEGGFRADKTFENKWSPDRTKDYKPETSKVIVVIRDNRGGVDWRAAAVKLEAAP
jgi:hypothetical protein